MIEKFICFDIGGTKIFKSVVEINFAKRSFDFLDSEVQENPVDSEKIRELILGYCNQSKNNFDTNKVAISSPSIVDKATLTVCPANNSYDVDEFSFDFLKKESYQIVLENDGEAFALGEYYFDNNEGKEGLLTLTLGTRIGGGYIDPEGKILIGKDGMATEFSYMRVSYGDNWENWGEIAAGIGIEKIYKNETGKTDKAKKIFEISESDEKAKKTLEIAQNYLGQGIISLVEVFNPEKIVFGGNISSQKEYIEGAMEIVRENIFHKKAFPEWSISELKAEMNVLGVCALYYV